MSSPKTVNQMLDNIFGKKETKEVKKTEPLKVSGKLEVHQLTDEDPFTEDAPVTNIAVAKKIIPFQEDTIYKPLTMDEFFIMSFRKLVKFETTIKETQPLYIPEQIIKDRGFITNYTYNINLGEKAIYVLGERGKINARFDQFYAKLTGGSNPVVDLQQHNDKLTKEYLAKYGTNTLVFDESTSSPTVTLKTNVELRDEILQEVTEKKARKPRATKAEMDSRKNGASKIAVNEVHHFTEEETKEIKALQQEISEELTDARILAKTLSLDDFNANIDNDIHKVVNESLDYLNSPYAGVEHNSPIEVTQASLLSSSARLPKADDESFTREDLEITARVLSAVIKKLLIQYS